MRTADRERLTLFASPRRASCSVCVALCECMLSWVSVLAAPPSANTITSGSTFLLSYKISASKRQERKKPNLSVDSAQLKLISGGVA